MTESIVIAEPRSGIPVGAWPRAVVLLVASAAAVAITGLWWILLAAVLFAGLVVWDLRRSGGRRDLRANADGLVGTHRGQSRTIAWSAMTGVEFVRPRSSLARPIAHIEVGRHDDPFDTAFVALVLFDKADAQQVGDRLSAACAQHNVPFQDSVI